MTNQDLKKLIRKVRSLRDQGLSFEKIAVALNEKGFTNLEGEAWKRGAVERFFKRRVQQSNDNGRAAAAAATKSQPAKLPRPEMTILEPVIPSEGLDQVVTDLKGLLEWWRSRKEGTPLQTAVEPVRLAGPKRGATISINQYLLGMAKERALESGGQNSAALSGLVEFLLWRHLGSPTHDDNGTPIVLREEANRAAKA